VVLRLLALIIWSTTSRPAPVPLSIVASRSARFGPLRLGRFHERTLVIEDALGRQCRRHY
jgi:hypothetical protein